MLVHGMTLLSFRLFRKNLGNLREFFGQMVHRPPGKKLPVRLWLFTLSIIKNSKLIAKLKLFTH